MKTLEKGDDKVQKICDELRRKTIEPAQDAAQQILEEARIKRDEIIAQAEQEAKKIIANAHIAIEQERNVFHSSLQQSAKQSIEALRQEIERHILSDDLSHLINQKLSDPQIIANLINALVKDIEAKGIASEIEVLIPRAVDAKSVAALLLSEVSKKLENNPLQLAAFSGGAQVKLIGKKITIDVSDRTISELLAKYIRKDFREMLFKS